MFLRNYLSAAVLAAGLVPAAFAAPSGPGDLGVVTTAAIGNTVLGAFNDIYTFSVLSNSVVGASVTNISFSFNSTEVNAIYSFGANLDGVGLNFTTTSSPDFVSMMGYIKTALTPGLHTLTISGNAPAAASYGGNIAVASSVPEPETYAMMLAGVGAIGFLARRRKMQ